MILTNSQVTPGDRLFDIFAMEMVKVISVTDAGCTAMLGNGVTRMYSADGFYRGRRALYWHDPIVTDPPKDITEWTRLKRMVQAVIAAY